ncbi:Protein rds1, partial [Termitomyces sp. T112]
MKIPTTVLLSVFAFPYLVNARPSSILANHLDARDGQPPTTALGGTPSNPLGTTAKSFPGGGSTNEDNDILTKGPLAKGLISRSISDIERPWTKRQPIDDPTEGGLYTDKSYRYFTEAGSYDLDNKSPVSQMGKSLNKGSSAESGVPVGKELTDPKVDKTKSQLGPSNPST